MRKVILIFCLLFSFSMTVYSSANELKKSKILEKSKTFRLINKGLAEEELKVRLYINENTEDLTHLYIPYTRFDKLIDFNCEIKDTNGNIIKEFELEDLKDYSTSSVREEFTDLRINFIDLHCNSYPNLIEYKIKWEKTNLLNWPKWFPYSNKFYTDYSSFKIIIPLDYHLRFYDRKLNMVPEKSRFNDNLIYFWEKKDLSKLEPEFMSTNQFPAILTAPGKFEIDGIEGDLSSWKSFGSWYNKLLLGRQIVSEEDKIEIKKILAKSESQIEIINNVFNYVQDKTRYVSIQLGIGGWRPFTAEEVGSTGWGDCKGLANYTVSLLKFAGVDSYVALAKRKYIHEDIIVDFPSNQFNHMIVYIPLNESDLWLETTDNTISTGHVGSDNDDRHALVIFPAGGKLKKVKDYFRSKNYSSKKINIDINQKGKSFVDILETRTGNLQDSFRRRVINKNNSEISNFLTKYYSLKKMEKFKAEYERKNCELRLNCKGEIKKLTKKSGKRIFINLNKIVKKIPLPDLKKERINSVCFPTLFSNKEDITINFPENYKLESVILDREVDNSCFSFSIIVLSENNKLVIRKNFELKQKTIEVAEYEKIKDSFDIINSVIDQSIVLVK